MKFNININQKAIVDNKFDLDLADAAILDFLESWVYAGNIHKKLFYDKPYYWLDYQYLISEMPMLGIKSKDGIYRRLKKMCDMGLLIAHQDNQVIGKPYFAFGPKFELLHFDKPTDGYPKGAYQKPKGSRKSSVPPTDEKSDNNSINDHTIIDQGKIALPFESEAFKNAWNDWIKHRKQKGKKLTPLSIEKQLKLLSTFNEESAIKMVNMAITSNWQGIFPPKNEITLSGREENLMVIFESFFLDKTGVGYERQDNDNISIRNLYNFFCTRSIHKANKNKLHLTDEGIHEYTLNAFDNFLNLLNEFHRKRFLTPQLLYKNINTIVNEITHANSTTNDRAKSASDYV